MKPKTWTLEQLLETVDEELRDRLHGWHFDSTIAVYQNNALDSAACGHRTYLRVRADDTAPATLAGVDIPTSWAYLLEATVPCQSN